MHEAGPILKNKHPLGCQELPHHRGTRLFITVYAVTWHSSLSCAGRIPSTPHIKNSLRSIFVLCLDFPSHITRLDIPTNILYAQVTSRGQPVSPASYISFIWP